MGRGWIGAYFAAHMEMGPGISDILGALLLLIAFFGVNSPSRLIYLGTGIVALVFAHALIFRKLWIEKEAIRAERDALKADPPLLLFGDPGVSEWSLDGAPPGRGVRVTLKNDAGQYITDCYVGIGAIRSVGPSAIIIGRPGYLELDPSDRGYGGAFVLQPEERELVWILFRYDPPRMGTPDSTPIEVNWGNYSPHGGPDFLPAGTYHIMLHARGSGRMWGYQWLEVDTGRLSVRFIDEPPLRAVQFPVAL